MEADGQRFRLGVNYWPARTAMQWWPRFDPQEVAADFERIAAAGMDSVRCFLMWEDFQPRPDSVDRAMLERLVAVADAAASAGLQLVPTLFTGHMSGVNWIPGWALGGGERDPRFRVVSGGRAVDDGLRNWFADPGVADAQALMAAAAATALAGHEALWAWDLGNENSNCSVPPDRALARGWLGRIACAIRDADPDVQITIGLHMEDLENDRHLRPVDAAEVCDFLTMHGYPIYARWAEGSTDHHVAPFLACITRWLGEGADVVFSEFGLPTFRHGETAAPLTSILVEEDAAASYIERSLAGLRDAGCLGAMLWCYADYAEQTWADPPLDESLHERSFGLWRADSTAKPAVSIVTEAASGSCKAPPDDDWIDIDRERYWERPGVELPRLYRRYRIGSGG